MSRLASKSTTELRALKATLLTIDQSTTSDPQDAALNTMIEEVAAVITDKTASVRLAARHYVIGALRRAVLETVAADPTADLGETVETVDDAFFELTSADVRAAARGELAE